LIFQLRKNEIQLQKLHTIKRIRQIIVTCDNKHNTYSDDDSNHGVLQQNYTVSQPRRPRFEQTELVLAYFMALIRKFEGRTEENHENPQPR